MEATTATKATPEFVLEVLRDSHRHQCAFDPEADVSVELSFETTVTEWRLACDLVETVSLGVALNEVWGITLPDATWRGALEPSSSRTLRDVCELIAAHSERPMIRATGAFGGSCVAAGAFLAIRTLLLRAGAEGRAIRPSLPVADIARRFPAVFLGPISRLAPGRLPTVSIRMPWQKTLALATFGIGILGGIAGYFVGPMFSVSSAVVMAVGYLAIRLTARLKPSEVRFGAIETFRDLAQVIGGERTA